MEDRKMIELKVNEGWLWCDVCGDNEWGFYALHPFWGFEGLDHPFSVCQRCVRQHDQIDVRLRESAARLVEEADRLRSAGRSQVADWLSHEAAMLRYFIGRIKAPSDADWKALEVEIEAERLEYEATEADLARLEVELLPPELRMTWPFYPLQRSATTS